MDVRFIAYNKKPDNNNVAVVIPRQWSWHSNLTFTVHSVVHCFVCSGGCGGARFSLLLTLSPPSQRFFFAYNMQQQHLIFRNLTPPPPVFVPFACLQPSQCELDIMFNIEKAHFILGKALH